MRAIILTTIFLLAAAAACPPPAASEADYAVDLLMKEPGQKYMLTLQEASRLALENNFTVQLAKYDAWIERTGEKDAKSIYDTVLEAEASYLDSQLARATTITGTRNVEHDFRAGLSKKLPTGTTIGVGYFSDRTRTNSAFATINPNYDTAVEFSVNQELGRNFFGIQDRGTVKITKRQILNSRYLSLRQIEEEVARVQGAYWELILQMEQVRTRRNMLGQAKRLFEFNQDRASHGLVEDPELLASEANYRARANDLLLAENELRNKENILRLLLNIEADETTLIPTGELEAPAAEPALGDSIKRAFENRPDYQLALTDIEIQDIRLSMARQGLWPEIDLKASLIRNGLDRQFKEAFSEVTSEDNPEFLTSLLVKMPLENNAAEAEKEAARLSQARALVNLKKVERTIAVEIMNQVRTVKVLNEQAQNRRIIAELEQSKLKAEEKQFENGRSDTDTIIRFQEDVFAAEAAALEAEYIHRVALIDLNLLEGTILNPYWEKGDF